MSDGWQPAVDNLQSQINSINSQISVLSGKENSDATQITLLSSQLSALQTEVSAIQQQVAQGNTLVDLSGASVVLSNPSTVSPNGGAYTVASLNGSPAVLSVPSSPSIDGKLFRLTVAARVLDDGAAVETDFGGAFALGDASIFQSPTLGQHEFVGMNGTGIGEGTCFFEVDCLWDALSKSLIFSSLIQGSRRIGIGGPSQTLSGIVSQTDIKIVFGAFWNNTSNPASVVLTQFKLSLI